MLDIGWSELFVVGIIALLVVGPKELPALLRTIGRYMGMIKRQAAEFRAQFDEAIKDSEFEQVKKDFEELKSDAQATVREATQDIDDEMRELDDVRRGVDRDLSNALRDDAKAADNDDADDWIDEHNQTILEGEQPTQTNGTVAAGEDDGGQVETEGADQPAPEAGDPPVRQGEKARTGT
ncbi:MAG: Sec-independent protein translocase protein TatB [Hyphomicrobiaceae bacterium]